jgi:cytochrome P450
MEMHAQDSFSVAFEYASGKTGERFQNPLWQLTELFFGRRFRESVAEVKDFGADIVSNAVKARGSKEPSVNAMERKEVDSVSGSLINSLLDSIPDHQIVADAALNYLSAGRDTTAQSLTWTFYLLMRYPEFISKIRQELSSSRIACSGNLTNLTPSALPYTMAVFYESLRLYPPVPFEIKQCEQPTTLPDGTFLPRNTVVVWCTWAMNRSATTWGPESHEFRPERWITTEAGPGPGGNSNQDGPIEQHGNERGNESRIRLISRPAWEFPVFNGGPRTCLGKKMAEAIAAMVIASLASEFDFEEVEKGKERVSRNSLTLPMEGGLPCLVTRRKDSEVAEARR